MPLKMWVYNPILMHLISTNIKNEYINDENARKNTLRITLFLKPIL